MASVLVSPFLCSNPPLAQAEHAARLRPRRRRRLRRIRCVKASEVEEGKRVVVESGADSLEICRVVNGMWQTSGWGEIDGGRAVESMLRYADAGLATFDMADICKFSVILILVLQREVYSTLAAYIWTFWGKNVKQEA
ncbi:uncharacterized protein A4U43_C10F17240 [Asparagus officinalis]|uniref:NADP-dependent oxidoreductase domain-containing protein n=1 Tax=Asparagus officinalis TaxID=4686 RepID=A0A5P1E3D3_ASPOF|nr:uncharacterized protein A4U43_C10F17240 [Asparagus officinalis]